MQHVQGKKHLAALNNNSATASNPQSATKPTPNLQTPPKHTTNSNTKAVTSTKAPANLSTPVVTPNTTTPIVIPDPFLDDDPNPWALPNTNPTELPGKSTTMTFTTQPQPLPVSPVLPFTATNSALLPATNSVPLPPSTTTNSILLPLPSVTNSVPPLDSSETHNVIVTPAQFLATRPKETFFCNVCNISCSSAPSLQQHLVGKSHLKVVITRRAIEKGNKA